MPVILCTGYSSRIDGPRVEKMGIRALLMKPLNRSDLAINIRRVLDQGEEDPKGAVPTPSDTPHGACPAGAFDFDGCFTYPFSLLKGGPLLETPAEKGRGNRHGGTTTPNSNSIGNHVSKRNEIHDRVLNATNLEELMAAYGDWAEKYDHDLLQEMGYVAPMIATRMLEDHLAHKGARVLDAGCGTGIVGELLHQNGYGNIEGLDYSPQMLEKAGAKGIYRALNRGDLTGPLDIAGNTYDAVISVGTFTCGHVGPEAFEELVRITKPGGWLCFTVREQAWEEDDYRTRVEDMEGRGLWERQELTTADYIRQEGARCKVGLFRIPV